MLTLKSCTIEEKVREKSEIGIYRGIEGDGRRIVVKANLAGHGTPRVLARLTHEFEITRRLESDGIIRPMRLEPHADGLALIFRDFDVRTLAEDLEQGPMELGRFLVVSLQLSRTLQELHAHKIIHKDIKPENIVIDHRGRALLIDFGISSELHLKHQHLGNPEVLEGTLAYISPEQTGRMNRIIDFRSDLYSLGVTFFEMLTGQLPFDAHDGLELVHCHIARPPPALRDLRPDLPPVLDEIVLRLLAKNAEERYQSAFGLEHDLERCRRLRIGKAIDYFPPGGEDYSGRFQLPQKLYGRTQQLNQLLESFDRAAGGGCELMLVSGYSGVGKSALVYEVHKPITAKRGVFISGKYDQFQRNIPYYALRQAFSEFAKLLLTESAERLDEWRAKILEAVGVHGQVVIDVIPALESVLGPQPPVPELGPQEAQNRFNLVFQKFTRAISQAEHPLVLFVDDLQWADAASLTLLKTLMTDTRNGHFLLIGAYRDNEVDPAHPFILTLNDIRKYGAHVTSITLENLTRENVNEMIADALATALTRTEELCDLVCGKTHGNAFFVTELLKSLYEDDFLFFDFAKKVWAWDVSRIRELNLTDNVVDLMIQKLGQLSPASQEVLRLASCIGSRFNLKILSIINEKSQKDTMRDVWTALKVGLLLPLDENYKLITSFEDLDPEAIKNFGFQHDRVQQAAYALIPDDRRKEIHLRIARLLLAHTAAEDMEDLLFDIAYQFNSSLDLVTEFAEKLRIVRLNLQAADKAVKSSAFYSALAYVDAALQLFDESAWENHHDLIYHAYRLKASCEHSSYQLEKCAETIQIVLPRCRTEREKVDIYTIQLNNLFALNQHFEALDVIQEALKFLGIKIPRKPGKLDIVIEYFKFRKDYGRRKPEEILQLPDMTDEHIINVCRILYNSVESTYMVYPDMMALISVRMARICLRYGNSKLSGVSYAMTALVVSGVFKQLDFAWELSQLGFKLNEKYPHLDCKARCHFLGGNFTLHWVKPVEEHRHHIQTALQCAVDAGNVHWGNYSLAFSRTQSLFYSRAGLDEIELENARYYEFHARTKDREVTLNMYMLLGFIARLKNSEIKVPNVYDYEPEAYSAEMNRPGNFLQREYLFTIRMMEAYDRGDIEEALQWAWKGFVSLHEVLGVLLDFHARFFYQLVYLAGRRSLSFGKRIKMAFGYRINRFLLGLYARRAPENFRAFHLLVQAEEARAYGRQTRAERLYGEAAHAAEESRFPLIIAMAHQLAGEYYFAQPGKEKIARLYLTDAIKAYRAWGAAARAVAMESKYHSLLEKGGASVFHPAQKANGTSDTTTQRQLDLESVLKASRALSGEIRMESLLTKMMQVVMENAGAQRAVLLLQENDGLSIEASADASGMLEQSPSKIPSEDLLPVALIEYVQRSAQTVVLADAAREGSFTGSDYIQARQTRSAMALPILRQGQVIGVLYLENNLAFDVFTPQRVETLQLLGSQLAISIENSLLYQTMEKKVEERTSEVLQLRQSRAKMDPHYLFNSLNLIHSLLLRDPARADEALVLLGENYRYLLEYSNYELIPFEQEWKFLEKYLEFMKIRFQDNLEIKIRKPMRMPALRCPPLTLQPFAENSFKHGFRDTGVNRMQVTLTVSDENVEISFQDNGRGLEGSPPLRSIGEIRDRLRYYFKFAEIGLNPADTGQGTVARINFSTEYNRPHE